jgi:alpha-galactosidase
MLSLFFAAVPDVTFPLSEVPAAAIRQDYGQPGANKTVDGNPLKIGGTAFATGLGTHATGEIRLDLQGNAKSFFARVGVDDETKGLGSVQFLVYGDNRLLADSGVMKGGESHRVLNVPLKGVKKLRLVVGDAGDGISYDHADWAEAAIVMTKGRPVQTVIKPEPAMPIASHRRPQTEIHGPRVLGGTPGRDFIFRVPATGTGPLKYQATGLPPTLAMDARGVISGKLPDVGEYPITVTVSGARGKDTRVIKLVTGRGLAPTPPMGWNSWNCWAGEINADRVRAAADQFVSTDLAAYGYSYVNIDDCWQAGRDKNGFIEANDRFPDMKGLADYVHNLGLRIGTYSSPGPQTCAGFTGSYQHELKDAQQYASWGFDYLKYDWCSYGNIDNGSTLDGLKKPYIVMSEALKRVDRDIVLSLCQYGMGEVHQWGGSVGGQLWRTTGDITDTWGSMAGIGFDHDRRSPYVKPGAWNDPDMLVVGYVGWGNPHPSKLTANEQITHITLWSMLAAPLLIGCDLTKLDDFTKDLLMNHEVIEIDQDPLGKAARRVWKEGDLEVWTRPLFDGSVAVAFFNRGTERATISVPRSRTGARGRTVRNAWLRKDIGALGESPAAGVKATVPAHGAQLYVIR